MVLEYEIYLPLIITELSRNLLFNVNFCQKKKNIRLHPLDLLQLHVYSYSISAWYMKDLFLDRLIPVRGDSYSSKAKTLTWIHVLGTLQLVFSALGTFQCLL